MSTPNQTPEPLYPQKPGQLPEGATEPVGLRPEFVQGDLTPGLADGLIQEARESGRHNSPAGLGAPINPVSPQPASTEYWAPPVPQPQRRSSRRNYFAEHKKTSGAVAGFLALGGIVAGIVTTRGGSHPENAPNPPVAAQSHTNNGASSEGSPAPETLPSISMAQDLERQIMQTYSSSSNDNAGIETQESVSNGKAGTSAGGTTSFLVWNNNVPSNLPDYTGWYSASVQVDNDQTGAPDLSKIDGISIQSLAYKKTQTNDGSSQPLKLFTLQIVRSGNSFVVEASGISSKGPWSATNTEGSAQPNSTTISSLTNYTELESGAKYMLDYLVDGQPVDYVNNPVA